MENIDQRAPLMIHHFLNLQSFSSNVATFDYIVNWARHWLLSLRESCYFTLAFLIEKKCNKFTTSNSTQHAKRNDQVKLCVSSGIHNIHKISLSHPIQLNHKQVLSWSEAYVQLSDQ